MSPSVDRTVDDLMDDSNVVSSLIRPDRLTRLLHPASRTKSVFESDLLAIVERIGEDLAGERLTGGPLVGERSRRLFRTRAVEAYLVIWGSTTLVELHDHGGARGAFQLVAGQLKESSTDLETQAPLVTMQLGAGARRSLAPTHVHEMWNPTQDLALSVHAFSPPIESMRFFADTAPGYLKVLRTETPLEWPEGQQRIA